MENTSGPQELQLNPFPSAPSLCYPNSNSSEATSSSMPPPYTNPAEYPPTSGMPYPQQYPSQAPAMNYPQPYVVPPPGGQPYYPQPGGAYPGPPGVNYQTPQQQNNNQQQQVVVVNNQPVGITPVYLVNRPPVSMVGAIVLSCFAYWCFGMIFGGIAFILAMVGQSSAAVGDTATAIRMRNASYGVSIAGIIIGVIIVALVGGLLGSVFRRSYYSYYSAPSGYYCYSCYYNTNYQSYNNYYYQNYYYYS